MIPLVREIMAYLLDTLHEDLNHPETCHVVQSEETEEGLAAKAGVLSHSKRLQRGRTLS